MGERWYTAAIGEDASEAQALGMERTYRKRDAERELAEAEERGVEAAAIQATEAHVDFEACERLAGWIEADDRELLIGEMAR